MKGNALGGAARLNRKIKEAIARITKNEQDISKLNSEINELNTNFVPKDITAEGFSNVLSTVTHTATALELVTPHLVHLKLVAESSEAIKCNGSASGQRWGQIASAYRPTVTSHGTCRTSDGGFGDLHVASTGYVNIGSATVDSSTTCSGDVWWTI